MYEILKRQIRLPEKFEPNVHPFWDDAHISGKMLKAHLDPEFEGASRKQDFIAASVSWIGQIAPVNQYPRLLDLGCGPGLYAERLAGMGYRVTGLDFSRRSIDYAKQSALQKGIEADYYYQNYLKMEYQEVFDIVIMIYCDYGALPPADRQILLEKVYHSLKPGGLFLFDVFSHTKFCDFHEEKTWEHQTKGGFWSADPYLLLQNNCKYPDSVTLEQTLLITDSGMRTYHIWNQYFTASDISKETGQAGFTILKLCSDVVGTDLSPTSDTIAVLARK